MPATETYRVVEMENDFAVVQFQRRIEGQETGTKFQQAIDAMVGEFNPDHKPRTSFAKVTVLADSLIEGRMDLKSGWPQSVSWIDKLNDLKSDQLKTRRKVEVKRAQD